MTDRFEQMLVSADFTKESDLYESLRSNILDSEKVSFLKAHVISDDDLEMLAAAGTSEGRAAPLILSDNSEDAEDED